MRTPHLLSWCSPVLALLLASANALAAPHIKDADTRAWWSITSDLSGDDMEGRDTGSPGHARAVRYVEEKFKAAGLQPAGEGVGYTRAMPLHEVKVEKGARPSPSSTTAAGKRP